MFSLVYIWSDKNTFNLKIALYQIKNAIIAGALVIYLNFLLNVTVAVVNVDNAIISRGITFLRTS